MACEAAPKNLATSGAAAERCPRPVPGQMSVCVFLSLCKAASGFLGQLSSAASR